MWLQLAAAACLAFAASCWSSDASLEPPLPEIRVRASEDVLAPVSLTASDGTGLLLRELQAKVVLEPPLAFTQLELVFQNPEPRRIEGRLELALPERASISRLALQISGEYQEGELVEQPRAVAAYEEALHKRRDPALLERDAGNQYRMRVFPIEAHEVKRVIIAYSELIAGDGAAYRLPLSGLPAIDRLRAEVSYAPGPEGTAQRVFERQHWQPDGDLLVSLPEPAGKRAIVSGNLALLPLMAASQSRPAPLERLTLLVDTSASAAAGFEQRIARMRRLLAELHARRGTPIPLQLVVFDQEVVPLIELRSDQLGPELEAQLRARGALGATDFEAALRGLARLPDLGDRVIAFTDGIATAGANDGATLADHVSQLSARGVQRFDVVTHGSIADRATLEALVHAELPEAGVIVPDDDPAAAAIRLLRGTERRVEIEVSGAEWTYPSLLHGVEPDRVYPIFAKLRDPQSLEVRVSGEPVRLRRIQTQTAALLERECARAQIEYLEQQQTAGSEADAAYTRERIVELSVRHRVLSDATAWAVLETETDYARHGIARSQSPRLVVRDGGVITAPGPERVADSRAREPWMGAGLQAEHARGALGRGDLAQESDSITSLFRPSAGIGWFGRDSALGHDPMSALGASMGSQVGAAFGFVGTGRGLGAVGGARSYRGRSALVPWVRTGKSIVHGELSSEVVRRVIQRHINEVRFCHEQELNNTPELAGRVVVKFIIGPSGAVQASAVSSSTLRSARAEQCIVNAVRRWTFPAPDGGGIAVVTHPFELESGWDIQAPERERVLNARRERARREQEYERLHAREQEYERLDAREQEYERRERLRAWRERPRPTVADALTGPLLEVVELLEAGAIDAALARARVLQRANPLDTIALLSLARAASASGDRALAARAYGSLIDLFPSRAELRRAAGQGLEELGTAALALAIDSYRKAAALRPDQPSGQRLLALALWRAGERAQAFAELERGRERGDPLGRFPGVMGVMVDDALRAETSMPAEPMVRICVYWENDATDVDLSVYDGMHRHVGGKRAARDGPTLSADVATGFGPECVTARGAQIAFPYLLQVHYATRGAMGHAFGAVHVMQVDRHGEASFEMRPFVLMKEGAFVELGSVGAKS